MDSEEKRNGSLDFFMKRLNWTKAGRVYAEPLDQVLTGPCSGISESQLPASIVSSLSKACGQHSIVDQRTDDQGNVVSGGDCRIAIEMIADYCRGMKQAR